VPTALTVGPAAFLSNGQPLLPRLSVESLFIVPKHFFTPEMIEKRNPLTHTAQRHGHVLSNIRIGNLPEDARIYVVQDGKAMPKGGVHRAWDRFRFLGEKEAKERGWINDVLS